MTRAATKGVLLILTVACLTTGCSTGGGSNNGGTPLPAPNVTISTERLGAVTLTAGLSGTISDKFNIFHDNYTSGTITVDHDNIVVVNNGLGSIAGGFVAVKVFLAESSNLASVCTSGDSYGFFTGTVDENGKVGEIDSDPLPLTQRTLDAINTGQISVCLHIDTNFDSKVTIKQLDFRLK